MEKLHHQGQPDAQEQQPGDPELQEQLEFPEQPQQGDQTGQQGDLSQPPTDRQTEQG